jgi:hypothetical protein
MPEEAFVDFMGLKLLPIFGALVLAVAGIGPVRNGAIGGPLRATCTTDRPQRPEPGFARETVVVEYAQPETAARSAACVRRNRSAAGRAR